MIAQRPPREAIRFRPSTSADESFLLGVYATTRDAEMRLVPWTAEQKTAFVAQQFTAQKNHYQEFYPNCEFLIIEWESEPIGRLYIDRAETEIEIIDIALLPQFQRLGIGRMLLEEILAEGKAAGKLVRIYVENFNPARRLYDRLGFRHVDTNGVYHCLEWSVEAPEAK